jgi:two-component system response regulator FixJ
MEQPMPDDQVAIYIVDDDKAVRESLASLLELEGYDVKRYETAGAFLSEVNSETVGVLLLDVRLPDINGLEVQAQLVEMDTKLSIIVITGHGDVPMAVKAIQAGAVNFIEKPFIGDVVIDSVRAAESETRHTVESAKEQQEIRERLDLLAPRELDVLRHLVIGQQNKVIAYELGISPRTVEVYRARVMAKMQADSLANLVRISLSIGLDTSDLS